jgi:Na+-transporting NADH:ubiquinone oxidoreductase subunit C
VLFAAAVCGVCSIFVSVSNVALRERYERNKTIDVQTKVLTLAGLIEEGEDLSGDEISTRFAASIRASVIDMATGTDVTGIDADTFDQRAAASDPETSTPAPENKAKVRRLPNNALVFQVSGAGGELESLILPIQGQGLWSTLYGFIALGSDLNTIRGITFYEHGETPGLGGEVDNPRWKALWPGRKAFNPSGAVAIRVKKGRAGSVEDDPHQVDGLSGATITSRGVSNTLQFWLGEDGFGSYLDRVRAEQGV